MKIVKIMPDKNLFCIRNQKHRTENTHLNSDISEDEFNKVDLTKRKSRFLISLDNNGSLKTFPIHIRSIICNYIKELLDRKESIDNIIKSIFYGLENKDKWISEIREEDLSILISKIKISEYYNAFKTHFKILVNVIRFLINNPSLSLSKVSKKFSLHHSIISETAKAIFNENEYYDRYLESSAHSSKQKGYISLLKLVLNSKKKEILNLEFIPTKENLFCEDNRLKLMKEQRLHNNLRYWLERNTNYSGVNEMKRIRENKTSISVELYKFLDKHKNEILTGNFIPNKTNLSNIDRKFDANITLNFVKMWLKKNSSFLNLTELIRHFKPTSTQLGYSMSNQIRIIMKNVKDLTPKIQINLPSDFNTIVETLYYDIVNSIEPTNNKTSFDLFYESMTDSINTKTTIVKTGLRNENSLAGVLIYYSLYHLFNNEHLTKKTKDFLINTNTLDNLEDIFGFGTGNLRKHSGIIHSYLEKIPKYKDLFSKLKDFNLERFVKNVTYNDFDCNVVNLSSLRNKNILTLFINYFSGIKDSNYLSQFFNVGFPRASDFKFIGNSDNKLLTQTIEDFFVTKHNLIHLIKESNPLFSLCEQVQEIYDSYGVKSLGKEGHSIIEDRFLKSNYNLKYNIFPIAIELPVLRQIPNIITGHIDILAFLYVSNHLYILILDFKTKGYSEILKAIPQLTLYGSLLKEQIDYWSCKLNLNVSDNDYTIKCIGFNHETALAFDPFNVHDYIPKFLEYEKKISNRTKPVFETKSMEKLVAFFNKK